MKKSLLTIVLLMALQNNSWSQQAIKDTLFFKFNCNYITVIKNYEGIHHFKFKNEKLVSSAFDKITEENLFYFVQTSPPFTLDSLKPKKNFSLKKYLKKRDEIFRDEKTKYLDAYKIMIYFDKYIIYFLKDDKYLKVKVLTSLQE